MNDFYLIGIFILIGLFFYFAFTYKTKQEKEYKKHIKESLSDEYIIDPETGAKLTLEQAESGHWVQHDNEFRKSQEKHFTEEEKNGEKAVNYLRESREYRKYKFSDEELDFLESSKILSKYDDWSYSSPFRLEYCEGFVFHPAVMIQGHSYYDDDYHESQIMFWIKLDFDSGHYYLRQKTKTEKFFDKIRNDDDLKLEGYESFTFRKSPIPMKVIQTIEVFNGQSELEIEFLNQNLLIKNIKFLNEEDLFRMERIVKNICQQRV